MPVLYILVVAVSVGAGPLQIIAPPMAFNDPDDCRQAANLAVSLVARDMKAFCLDANTGVKIGEAQRGVVK